MRLESLRPRLCRCAGPYGPVQAPRAVCLGLHKHTQQRSTVPRELRVRAACTCWPAPLWPPKQ